MRTARHTTLTSLVVAGLLAAPPLASHANQDEEPALHLDPTTSDVDLLAPRQAPEGIELLVRAEESGDEIVTAPENVRFVADADALAGVVPDDAAHSFLGDPGEQVWLLPNGAGTGGPRPGATSLGWDTTGLGGGFTDEVTVRLLAVRGPGALAAFTPGAATRRGGSTRRRCSPPRPPGTTSRKARCPRGLGASWSGRSPTPAGTRWTSRSRRAPPRAMRCSPTPPTRSTSSRRGALLPRRPPPRRTRHHRPRPPRLPRGRLPRTAALPDRTAPTGHLP
ncbi:hypothetical protein [Actinoalloteichus caeruleus]|uniref:hypothetical protein n=1 Tax=Actinoalloteichus cyanogriseus TaxID=2893586 RepID=UPI0020A569EE|nr:hypothetical protein [Actinoalloteichus caeruleus]